MVRDHDPLAPRLPSTYSLALELCEEGLDERRIAQRLDIPREAVRSLLHLAEAKLARIARDEGGPTDASVDRSGHRSISTRLEEGS